MNCSHAFTGRWLAAVFFCSALTPAGAQGQAATGIYTCVDARGRTLTSDRPIAECLDRTQRELNPSGTVKREVPPPLTAHEVARREEAQRAAAEEQARRTEEKRKERALVLRYPNQAPHDRDRREALAAVDVMIQMAQNNLSELASARKRLDQEMEFYANDPSLAPPALQRQLGDNQQRAKEQTRLVAEQQREKTRIHRRFDEELARLRLLWGASAGADLTPAEPSAGRQPRP